MRHTPTYVLVVLFCLVVVFMGLSSPAHAASKIEELKAACKENPSHVICQEREAKQAQAKARREAKMNAAIQRVKENK